MSAKPKIFWIDKDPPKPGPFHYATMNSFYTSPPWRRLRMLKLTEDPFCERCHIRGLVIPASQVHHIKEVDEFPELALVYNNLESLCETCHSCETAHKRRKCKKGAIYNYAMKNIEKRNP